MKTKLTREQQRLCQRIQDEQGFLITAMCTKHPIGSVLRGVYLPNKRAGRYSEAFLPAVRIIGYATPAEYQAQYERYAPKELGPIGLWHEFFCKVVAE